MHQKSAVAVLSVLLCACATAEDNWVWRTHNRHERAFSDNRSNGIRNGHDKYRSELYAREREPTTKRPIPGEIQSDDIEDYPDVGSSTNSQANNVGTRQFPFAQPGIINAGQVAGGVPGGYGGYPGGGYGGNPGILVGPGGPTGIIGRPQQFPVGAGGAGSYQPGFGGFQGGAQAGLGYPGLYTTGGLSGGNYPTQGFYPGQQASLGPQFPGSQYPINGQYPLTEYGAGNQFNQFGPGVGQFAAAGAIPQYTEGYGLAYTNGQPSLYGGGAGGIYPGNFGFDEADAKRGVAVAEGKSAKIESKTDFESQNVNDKISKSSNRN